jgi:hypothetical protein
MAVTEPLNKPLVKQVQDEVAQNTATQQFAFLFPIFMSPQGSNLDQGSMLT